MPDPNKIEGGRWDGLLRAVFNLKGAGSTSARIAEDISPTFNIPFRTEHDFLLRDKLLVGRTQSGPMADQNPRCLLSNVSGASLIIVERVVFQTDGNGVHYFGWTSAQLPFLAAVPIFVRDGRWGPLEQDVGLGTARLQQGTLVGAPVPIIEVVPTSTTRGIWEGPVVLAPGDHFFLTGTTLNSSNTATFYWREHLMEPSEVA